MSPWTYGNVRLAERPSTSRQYPASGKASVNAVLYFVKDQGSKHTHPIIISTKHREGTYAQNKDPKKCAGVWKRAASSELRNPVSPHQPLLLRCFVCTTRTVQGVNNCEEVYFPL